MNLTSLNPYMVYIKLAGFALALLAAAGATHYVDANVYGKQISDLNLAHEKEKTVNVTASLNQLQGFIDKMHSADAGYNNEIAAIDQKFNDLKKGLANALRTPLPPDCKPTVDRVRSFHDALDAANKRTPAVP